MFKNSPSQIMPTRMEIWDQALACEDQGKKDSEDFTIFYIIYSWIVSLIH